jgi:hypothetical protein
MDKETYLGDGVYASFDGYQIWLRTMRDDGRKEITHMIAIDPMVFIALVRFGERFWAETKPENA